MTKDQICQEIHDLKYGLGFLPATSRMIALANAKIAELQKQGRS